MVDRLTELRAAGYRPAGIAREMGLNPNQVAGALYRFGLTVPTPALRGPRPKIGAPSGGCSWPDGTPGRPDFRFCGAPRLPGKSYCARHHARAVAKTPSADKKPLAPPARP